MAVSPAQKTYNTWNSLPLKALVFVPFLGNIASLFPQRMMEAYIGTADTSLEENKQLLQLKNQFKAIEIVGGLALAIALAVLLAKGICPDMRFKAMAYLMLSATVSYNSYNAYCFYKNRHVIEIMQEDDILSSTSDEPFGSYPRLQFH